jgi:hypothetical protein
MRKTSDYNKAQHAAAYQETAASIQAFEDYYSLGFKRTRAKLLRMYQEQAAAGEDVPTVSMHALVKWYGRFQWKTRVRDRVIHDSTRWAEQASERVFAHRRKLMAAIELDTERYIDQLKKNPGKLMTQGAGSLELLTKLYFQLVNEPLVQLQKVQQEVKHVIGSRNGDIQLDEAGLIARVADILGVISAVSQPSTVEALVGTVGDSPAE